MKILLVEDSKQLNKALAAVLKRNSFVVDSAFDGEEALFFIKEFQYDAIILDVMLPEINGIEVLKKARQDGLKTPVIMLTAKSTTEDKIVGLDAGADDYLTKPFVVEELLARLRALIRRNPGFENSETIKFGDVTLDLGSMTLSKDDKKAVLANKEMQIMTLLMKQNGKVVSIDLISQNVWDFEAEITNESIWVFISYLRKKLENIGSFVKIKSIRYQGYCLEYNHD